jgi:cytosine/uracil/thiamine/allantoin permease
LVPIFPVAVLIDKTKDAGRFDEPKSLGALFAVATTSITYFGALYLNFRDFSRYPKSEQELRIGKL